MTRLRPVMCVAVVLAVATACQLPDPPTTPGTVPSPPVETTTTTAAVDLRDELGKVRVDDNPNPQNVRYDSSQWAFASVDGCPTRDVVLAHDAIPGTVQRSGRCEVTYGTWPKVYLSGEYTGDPDPACQKCSAPIQIDHVVARDEAHESGGWAWAPARKREFANDLLVLRAVDGEANRVKGSKPPNVWRPADRSVWCSYGRTRIEIKAKYDLTWRTEERDATGQLLEAC